MKRELTNQELLDRYIHSIKTMLPPAQTEDIAAEIRSHLESLAEDEAALLGRELTLQEFSAILKQHGHPVIVAKRYHQEPRPALIGPELFPFYWLTLRSLLGLIFTILAIIAIFKVVREPNPGRFLLNFSRDILIAEFCIAAGITLLFAVWEFLEFRFEFWKRWKPELLPPVPPQPARARMKRQAPALFVMGGIVWLIFLSTQLSAFFSPWFWAGKGTFVPSETLYALRLPLFLLALLWIPESWLDYSRFAKAPLRPYVKLVLNVAAFAWALVALNVGDLLVPGPQWIPARGPSLENLNRVLAGFLTVSCILSALRCLFELRQLPWRPRSGGSTATSAN